MAGGPHTLQCTQLPRCHLLHPQQQAGHICQHPPGAKETETLQAISRCCKMMAELGPKPTCCGSEFGLHPVPQHMEICPTDPTGPGAIPTRAASWKNPAGQEPTSVQPGTCSCPYSTHKESSSAFTMQAKALPGTSLSSQRATMLLLWLPVDAPEQARRDAPKCLGPAVNEGHLEGFHVLPPAWPSVAAVII